MDGLLQALQAWYATQCDGEWEHNHGIEIESCDHDGWWVRIGLVGTDLQGRAFEPIALNVDASRFQQGDRWLCCYVESGV